MTRSARRWSRSWVLSFGEQMTGRRASGLRLCMSLKRYKSLVRRRGEHLIMYTKCSRVRVLTGVFKAMY